MGIPSRFSLLLADVDVLGVVGHLHPVDVAEVRRADGLGVMQVLVDDRLLFLDGCVVHFANEMLFVVAGVVLQDFVVFQGFDVHLFEILALDAEGFVRERELSMLYLGSLDVHFGLKMLQVVSNVEGPK